MVEGHRFYLPESDLVVHNCDDYAIYTSNVLVKSLAAGINLPLSNPMFFTVMWMTGWVPGGHNVCIINVPTGGYAYMDYGMPTGNADTVEGVAKNIVERYAKGSDIIGFQVSEYNLTPVKYYWG